MISRGEANRPRNTTSCAACLRHRQKCNNRNGYPCVRCKEKKYDCIVISPASPTNDTTAPEMEVLTQRTRPAFFVTEGRLIVPHLGRIIYVNADRTSDGISIVLYQPTSGNTHHIYKATCDDEYNVYGKVEYLCTESEWLRNSERLSLT